MKNADNQKLKKLKIKIGCVIIAAILVMLVLPVFVNILFLISAPTKIMVAQYSGEGVLIYFSAALSCVGTLSLGLMTVYLNYKQDIFNEMIYENNVKPVLGVGFERKTRENPFDLTLRVSNLSSIINHSKKLFNY